MAVPKRDDKIVTFAKTNFRNQHTNFGIKQIDRRRHMYLIGKTGMGKSTVMENMLIQDIINGQGVALIDPHGDFAEKILDFIPNERVNDVIYFNPADMEYPIAFNVMEVVDREHKHLIASGLVGVFKKLWADSWGPRLEYLLRNAILALLDYPESTLLGVMRILSDKSYRKKVIAKIQDPVVKAFWVEEFSKYPQQFQVEAVAPIQNKVGQFLSTALIRNVVGQVKSTFDLRDVMDNQKILIMNLSKGRIGEDSSALLGAMMITKIQLAAMSRIDTPEEERKDFYTYVDEFQNFATDSFASILSEARKYRLDLIIGHQYIEQLEDLVRAAVFGNVGTIMCFRVGSADAEFLATEFSPYFVEEDLVNLTKFDVYMKLMIDGVASNPFSATTLPPLGEAHLTKNKQKVIDVSRERYAKPREVVEDKINRWSGVMTEEDIKQKNIEENIISKEEKDRREAIDNESESSIEKSRENFKENRQRNTSRSQDQVQSTPKTSEHSHDKNRDKKRTRGSKDKNTYTINCYECGDLTEINFKPDGIRPIYCNDCFKKSRDGILHSSHDTKVKEVPVQAQEEISLADALSQEPKAFEKQKSKRPERPDLKSQKSEPMESSNQPTILEPGQVIKF